MIKRNYYETLPFRLGDIVEFPHSERPHEKDVGIVSEIRAAYEPGTSKVIPGHEIYTVRYKHEREHQPHGVPCAWHAHALKHTRVFYRPTYYESQLIAKQAGEWHEQTILDLTGESKR